MKSSTSEENCRRIIITCWGLKLNKGRGSLGQGHGDGLRERLGVRGEEVNEPSILAL